MSDFKALIRLKGLSASPRDFRFTASQAECDVLAARFGLHSLSGLDVSGSLRSDPGAGGIRLQGCLQADLEQLCGISLEPVAETVGTEFDVLFTKQVAGEVPAHSLDQEFSDQDVEPYPEAEIDIGEIAAQYLSMAINPFPRKAGADISAKPPAGVQILTEEEAVAAASPFANLKKLNEKG